ncbi:hypothetical protein D5086_017442 [Populus alba]|uniref:Uncharacterized protein n=1 Tax=Populus alba TaxID=43335 RepID=A0ACC4BXI9_POPAL
MVTSGSSPDKFLILAEDGSSPQPVASSPSTPDHVLVEDCSDEDDYEDEIVDYSTSGCPTVTPSTGNNLDAAFNSASRVLPLNGPGHSAFPVTTSTKRSSPPVTALPQTSPGLVEVDHSSPTEVPNVISSPTACPHSGAPQPPAPVEKWRDLFATNRSTTTGSSQHAQQTLDPLQAEVEAVTGGWEVVKRKKSNARHKETSGPAAPQRVTSRDKEVACSNKGKEVACSMDVRVRGDESIAHPNISNEGRSAPAALSSGDTRPIIIHEKEPAGASTSRTNPNVVSVGIVNNRGKRRSSSRGSGGRVLPSSTNI